MHDAVLVKPGSSVTTPVEPSSLDTPRPSAPSVAGLYLWLSGPESMSAFDLVGAFAELGIVVAPGDFYGDAGAGRVRMSLTDTDARVAAAAARLRSPEAAALFAG